MLEPSSPEVGCCDDSSSLEDEFVLEPSSLEVGLVLEDEDSLFEDSISLEEESSFAESPFVAVSCSLVVSLLVVSLLVVSLLAVSLSPVLSSVVLLSVFPLSVVLLLEGSWSLEVSSFLGDSSCSEVSSLLDVLFVLSLAFS